MTQSIRRLAIQPAQNGFLVYINEDYSQSGTVRPVPYVFETLESLQRFISEKFQENQKEESLIQL